MKNGRIVLSKIVVENNIINYEYSLPQAVDALLRNKTRKLFIELPKDIDATVIPQSILSIPFVGTFFPLAMCFGYEICVEEIEKTYVESLLKIQSFYDTLVKRISLSGGISANKLVTNETTKMEECSSLFFTGGLDASSALVETIDYKPFLINVWGGDVATDDDATHNNLAGYFSELAEDVGTEFFFVKSNCRELFLESNIDKILKRKLLDRSYHGYWSSFAHIIVMGAMIAPLIWIKGIKHHYIGSSYEHGKKVLDGNCAEIVEALNFLDCQFVPIDTQITRSQKAEKIVKYHNKAGLNLKLKVCWYRTAAENCSSCEKCYRTMLDILASHGDPSEYGFTVTQDTYIRIKEFVSNNVVNYRYWKSIQKHFNEERSFWEAVPEIAWLLNIKINSLSAIKGTLLKKLKK